MEPKEFKKIIVAKKNIFTKNQYEKTISHLDKMIEKEEELVDSLEKYLIKKFSPPNAYTGYNVTSFEKFFNMILFFINNAFFRLRLNKFLFYADFLNYRRTGYSISGVPYVAITNGPVAEDYNTLFSLAIAKNYISEVESLLPSGDSEEKFVSLKKFDESLFDESELKSMNDVLEKFKFVKTDRLKKMSHDEDGWKDNKDKCRLISYQNYAFLLKHV